VSEPVRKTSKTWQEKLQPTPAQERPLAGVLWGCRTRYTTALAQRLRRWKQPGVSLPRSQQEAERKALRADLGE